MNQKDLNEIVSDIQKNFAGMDRDLLNLTTLYNCEGDDLFLFYIKTVLETRDLAIGYNTVLTNLHVTVSKLDCRELVKGLKSFRNLIRSLSKIIAQPILICEA